MPIYEFMCSICEYRFESIESFEESQAPRACPVCDRGIAKKIPSISIPRMERIFDNAERGPRAFFGEKHAKHEGWRDLAEESEMVERKRKELVKRGELNDFIFEKGKYSTDNGKQPKKIEEV